MPPFLMERTIRYRPWNVSPGDSATGSEALTPAAYRIGRAARHHDDPEGMRAPHAAPPRSGVGSSRLEALQASFPMKTSRQYAFFAQHHGLNQPQEHEFQHSRKLFHASCAANPAPAMQAPHTGQFFAAQDRTQGAARMGW